MSPKSELWVFIVEIVTHLLDHQLELELLLHPGDALHSVPDLLHGRGIVTHLIKVRMRVTERCTMQCSVNVKFLSLYSPIIFNFTIIIHPIDAIFDTSDNNLPRECPII